MSSHRRVLPHPRWHGSPNNLLPRYVTFLTNFRTYQQGAHLNSLIRKQNQATLDADTAKRHIEDINKALVTAQSQIDEASLIGEAKAQNSRLVTLSQSKAAYQSLVDEKTHHIRELREAQVTLRSVNAELAQHRLQIERSDNSIDLEGARRELELITTGIPGVMGLRFRSNAPVIHVRTSTVWDGRRYDLGDFEVSFSISSRHAARRIVPTRLPEGVGDRRLYWQAYEDVWFCFGDRAEQLDTLFAQGSFAQFLHYAVNSLCEVNQEDAPQLQDYPIIPMDEVWFNRPRRRARRPQKKG